MVKIPRETRDRLIKQLRDWFEEARTAKEEIAGPSCTKWDDLEYYYQFGSKTPKQTPWWWADVKVNLIRSRVDRIVGLYVGERPQVSFDPQEPDDRLLAEYMGKLCKNDWSNGGMDREFRYVMTDAAILGTGIWKSWFDEIAGRIRTRRINPRNFFVDADADPSANDCEFIGEVAEVPLSKVLSMVPGLLKDAAYASGETIQLGSTYGIGQSLPNNYSLEGAINLDGFAPVDTKFSEASRVRVQYGQFYVREIAKIEWLLDKDTISELEKLGKSYVITFAANRIVSVKASPFDKAWHPYTVFRSGIRTNSWWGDGDVAGLMKAQDGLDIIVSRTAQHIQATVNPWYVGNAAMQNDIGSDLAPVPNEVVWVNGDPSSALVAQRPPELPGATLGVIDHLVSLIDDRSGVEPSVRGRHQAGVTSGVQEQQLQAQLAERNKPRLDDRDESLKLWGVRYSDLALDSYKKKHVKRVLGKDKADDWDELVKTKKGEFDIVMQVGAGISGDPEGVMNLAMGLHERQILGDPADPATRKLMLEIISRVWPGAQGVIAEIDKAIDAQREQQVQQMTGAPQAGAVPGAVEPPPPPGAPVAPEMQPMGAPA